ncbi:hypothetical protein [Escherichia whittamii]|uniref:hypothetical protein n=1 Tax=Escherichia whittamii TaxID=2762229 RepID=UPI002DBE3074|nr:hypothetical protein [Escherichia whittamii]MEB7935090.1 hypothetical protein [Escherichia whittamii]
MWMLTKRIALGVLLLCSFSATAGHSLEETARRVILAFQQEDARLINSLIDKKTGLYVLFRRGVSMDVENVKQIDFRLPVPEYLPWPSVGEHIPRDDEFDKKTIPEFDCERGWNKHGYFISNSDTHHKVSRSLVFTQMFGSPQNTISDAQVAVARRMEYGAVRVVAAPEKGSDGLVFYLSQLYGYDSDWYLTVVDQIGDCGG